MPADQELLDRRLGEARRKAEVVSRSRMALHRCGKLRVVLGTIRSISRAIHPDSARTGEPYPRLRVSSSHPIAKARSRVHVSFCACRWRGEIVNGGIPDSLVMWDGFGALGSGICPGGTGSWMGRRPC